MQSQCRRATLQGEAESTLERAECFQIRLRNTICPPCNEAVSDLAKTTHASGTSVSLNPGAEGRSRKHRLKPTASVPVALVSA